MLETIGYILLFTFFGLMGAGAAYMFYSFIRDDRRSERERKEKQKNAK